MFEKLNIPVLGVIENMSYLKLENEESLQLFPKGQLDEFLKQKNLPKLGKIPFSTEIGLYCEEGLPFLDNTSDKDMLQAFETIIQKISDLNVLSSPQKKAEDFKAPLKKP